MIPSNELVNEWLKAAEASPESRFIVFATLAAAWGAQQERERIDNAQWRRIGDLEESVGGVRDEMRSYGEGIDELRFNVRRFMEDGGIRYIERAR